jgi:hypothetical protein
VRGYRPHSQSAGGSIVARKRRVAANGQSPAARTLWAYGYELVPSHPQDRIAEIRDLIERQNQDAAKEGRTWNARLVTRRVTHVMIVSTSPDVDLDHNRRLEAELTGLGVQFLTTVPMRVSDDPDADL